MHDEALRLLGDDAADEAAVGALLASVGFSDPLAAWRRLRGLCGEDADCRDALVRCLPALLVALSDAATPDGALVHFERLARSVGDRAGLFRSLAENPRGVEIAVRLFVGSQFLTEILLRNPTYLEQLTQHKRLAELKSRPQFFDEARQWAAAQSTLEGRLDALRRYQQWELLRIGACDAFGLLDLKSVTVQLSLLADSLVQGCLALLADELRVDPSGFVVLALGKLGGEELNYSSDIDLIFLADHDAPRFWPLGQRLIRALLEPTGEGFLYRVDMRLRPWGRSGALVNTVDSHIGYLAAHGQPWEKQALLKARPIAGSLEIGEEFLRRARPLIFETPIEALRRHVREAKARIEADLRRQGRTWGEVKGGEGSIRDIEFVTQFLQLAHGRTHRAVQSINTLDGLVRLADFGLLHADEFRHLTAGYVFLRTIEHALQLMHHKQTHTLPSEPRELAYLARRLDYPGTAEFLEHYRRHVEAIRAIYNRHLGDDEQRDQTPATATEPAVGWLGSALRRPQTNASAGMTAGEASGWGLAKPRPQPPEGTAEPTAERPADHQRPSYLGRFDDADQRRHAALLRALSSEVPAAVEARPLDDGLWEVTVAGDDHPGDLSCLCGLLFVHGFDIVRGHAFSDDQLPPRLKPAAGGNPDGPRRFVDVFTIRPAAGVDLPRVWTQYERDLQTLLRQIARGRAREAHGELAKRVARALRGNPAAAGTLFPVEIEIDNAASDAATVLHIRSVDTMGFLYELANALALTGIDIRHVTVSSTGHRVFDTLHVTDARGAKITDPRRLQEVRAAVVLIKHFTHLLPRSPNPEAALLHFRELVEQLFQQPDWVGELATLERSDVLDALARLLGESDFLWEDFLRRQHENLFPVVRDVEALSIRKPRETLAAELDAALAPLTDPTGRREMLNAFKDREMFRTDMRHILGRIGAFGEFSQELTDVAEVIVVAAWRLCDEELRARHGTPRLPDGRPCPVCFGALGKFGGRELGFASDIELIVLYEGDGRTDGREPLAASEYFARLVENFTRTIPARREGIFQVDLRLRPYGRAGSLAVRLDAFRGYFGPQGAAWPFERQALVKLRPVAGDADLGRRVVRLRDELIYTGGPFDATAMRAMREKQVRQLVRPGTFNAKLSPGGLVDCEYLVQGLQITHGHRHAALRTTNTLDALSALRHAEILTPDTHRDLCEAYIFLRQLIDALRMVRGHARDLTVPPVESEEFEFLTRRLHLPDDPARLHQHIEQTAARVQSYGTLLGAGRASE